MLEVTFPDGTPVPTCWECGSMCARTPSGVRCLNCGAKAPEPSQERQERPLPDLTTTCPVCAVAMLPVHSHYQCPRCGWRDSCCF